MSLIPPMRLLGSLAAGLALAILATAKPTGTHAQADTAPAPIPAGKVLLTDDFSNTGSGWFVAEYPFGKCGYDNGEYQLITSPAGSGVIFCSRPEVARDFVVEIDAWLPGGGDEEAASLLVRAKWCIHQERMMGRQKPL
jgi:hypothetical protein